MRRRTIKQTALLLFFLIPIILPDISWSRFYKWVEEDGSVHYADSPEKVPAKYRNRSKDVTEEILKHGIIEKSADAPSGEQAQESQEQSDSGKPVKKIQDKSGLPVKAQEPSGQSEEPATLPEKDLPGLEDIGGPGTWASKGRTLFIIFIAIGAVLHIPGAFRDIKAARYLEETEKLYSEYIAAREEEGREAGSILEMEEEMPNLKRLLAVAPTGSTIMRMTKETQHFGGHSDIGTIDILDSILTSNKTISGAILTIIRRAAGYYRYEGKNFFNPHSLGDLLIRLPRKIIAGLGLNGRFSERGLRFMEIVYWMIALLSFSIW